MKKKSQENKEKAWDFDKLRELIKENWLSVVLAIAGLALVLIGGAVMIQEGSYRAGQEIAIEESAPEGEKIMVDIEGAVLNPGVYELPFSSRVQDLLIAAGGLSGEADREWVAQNLNQAAKIKDGEKFYIPQKGEGGVKGDSLSAGKTNINTASLTELDRLPDVGTARGQSIINGRPYSRIEELLEREIIPSSTFGKIKDKISVY